MIGPLQAPVSWHGITYAMELPKQIKELVPVLCFGNPTALFAPQHNLFRTMLLDRAKDLLPVLFELDELLTKLSFS